LRGWPGPTVESRVDARAQRGRHCRGKQKRAGGITGAFRLLRFT
jgi:hypothetical protein